MICLRQHDDLYQFLQVSLEFARFGAKRITMDKYLSQLIEDMRESAQNPGTPQDMKHRVETYPEEIQDHLQDVERYLHGDEHPLSEILRIPSVQLPPENTMSDSQISNLYSVMLELLEAYCFFPDFPEKLPVRFRYDALRKCWDDPHVYMGGGEFHLEFCSYEPEHCPFPKEYCHCNRPEDREEA